jgi:hypothetical protein
MARQQSGNAISRQMCPLNLAIGCECERKKLPNDDNASAAAMRGIACNDDGAAGLCDLSGFVKFIPLNMPARTPRRFIIHSRLL